MTHLYVSHDLRLFEAPADTALAKDITQGDFDCRRAYRRLDGKWWAYLSTVHKGYNLLTVIRARLVELRGVEAVIKAEALRVPFDYLPPFPVSYT